MSSHSRTTVGRGRWTQWCGTLWTVFRALKTVHQRRAGYQLTRGGHWGSNGNWEWCGDTQRRTWGSLNLSDSTHNRRGGVEEQLCCWTGCLTIQGLRDTVLSMTGSLIYMGCAPSIHVSWLQWVIWLRRLPFFTSLELSTTVVFCLIHKDNFPSKCLNPFNFRLFVNSWDYYQLQQFLMSFEKLPMLNVSFCV